MNREELPGKGKIVNRMNFFDRYTAKDIGYLSLYRAIVYQETCYESLKKVQIILKIEL